MSAVGAWRSAALGRRLCAALLLALGALAMAATPQADFAQNYAAARGWLMGLDPNGPTNELLRACCPDAPLNDGIPQTAHPPLATLLALPLALLPWAPARWLLLLLSWALVTLTWERLRTPPLLCLLTASFWAILLSLGALEPLLFALIGAAVLLLDRAPARAGAALGLALALKAYPGILLVGLLLAGRWRAAGAALAAAALATLAAELALGPGVTAGWLAYAQANAMAQTSVAWNISLVRLARALAPGLSPGLLALALTGLLAAPLAPLLRRGDPLRPMLPVMLLASPITWGYYLGYLGLCSLTWLERALIGVGGALLLLVWLHLVPGEGLAPLAYGPLLAAVALLWYRQARAALVAPRRGPGARPGASIEG